MIPETASDTVTRTRQQAEVRVWRLQDGTHDEARQRHRSVSGQYDIEVKPDTKGYHAIAVE